MTGNEISIIILAGGKSSRMHQDKGLLLLNGKMMIEHVLGEALKITDSIIMCSNNEAYKQFGFPCYPDVIKDCGPMGGIFTALQFSTSQKNLVLSCDSPFISSLVLLSLINHIGDEDALVAEYQNQILPLCAIYDKRCINFFKQLIKDGKLKMKDALLELNIVKVNFDYLNFDKENPFENINTPDELNKFQSQKNEN